MESIATLYPSNWKDYELIDTGNFEKLERFGEFITIRPEPQAIWSRKLEESEWLKQAHVKFIGLSSSNGKWNFLKKMPENWQINYDYQDLHLSFNLALTKFKHVGIFP